MCCLPFIWRRPKCGTSAICTALCMAREIDRSARAMGCFQKLPVEERGMKTLRTPLGNPERAQVPGTVFLRSTGCCSNASPFGYHVQSTWVWLAHCATASGNLLVRLCPTPGCVCGRDSQIRGLGWARMTSSHGTPRSQHHVQGMLLRV